MRIQATANHSKRTFTLRTYYEGKLSFKYRTCKMDGEEFEEALYRTQNDWEQFLRASNNYYKV